MNPLHVCKRFAQWPRLPLLPSLIAALAFAASPQAFGARPSTQEKATREGKAVAPAARVRARATPAADAPPASAPAASAPAPHAAATLPEDELKEGWINLFDGETLFGWTPLGDAQWHVADGAIVCEKGSGGWLASTSEFADFELRLQIKVTALKEVNTRGTSGHTAGIALRGGLEGHHTENGAGHILIPGFQKKDVWQEVRVTVQGDSFHATVDSQAIPAHSVQRGRGHVGIQFHPAMFSKVQVRNIKLRPLGVKPIFNGRDLSGWSILPGHASKFSVVDGALNIREGNGEIETTGKYKDFCLQLEGFSNGDHLNSGVFYRGTSGEFWSGYEIQIRNEWKGDDRRQPIDFGTGANYGNQPAREVVSSDREWFHLTVVCNDNHSAAWVNGYLVSDFLDSRPMSASFYGKSGYEPGPGTISLQGHDPTTDLSFRHIGIVEYPAR